MRRGCRISLPPAGEDKGLLGSLAADEHRNGEGGAEHRLDAEAAQHREIGGGLLGPLGRGVADVGNAVGPLRTVMIPVVDLHVGLGEAIVHSAAKVTVQTVFFDQGIGLQLVILLRRQSFEAAVGVPAHHTEV